MTFTDELHQTVAALTRLAVRGSEHLTAAELDVALLGRAAVLDLLAVMHWDVTGIKPRRGALSAADLQAHPVAALAVALRGHPRPLPARAPSDVLAEPVTSPAGQSWRDVARHTILAEHAWTTGRPPTGGSGDESGRAWAGLADVAAIAGVVADLDADLAQAATRLPGRAAVADALARAATSGLTLAARETATLATSGPLPPRGPQLAAAPNRVVVRVTEPAKVVAAQRQLAALLRTAGHVRPERLQLIAVGHVRACTALADNLEAGASAQAPVSTPELRHHIRLLVDAAGRRTGAASLHGSDPLPVRQAAELHQALHRPDKLIRRIADVPELAQGFAAALADTTRALAEVANRHLAAGAWLLQADVADVLTWQPSDSCQEVPQPFQALRAAAVHAEHLGRPHPEPDVPASPPRQALAPAPFTALRATIRPIRPSTPVIPAATRAAVPPRSPLRR